MSDIQQWLKEQDYWIREDRFREKCSELGVEIIEDRLRGITMKKDDDGTFLIPRRDLRRAVR